MRADFLLARLPAARLRPVPLRPAADRPLLPTRSGWFVATLFPLALVGCGGADNARLPLEGTVTLGGAPLDQGVIQFFPESPEGSFAGAEIRDGRYAVAAEQGLAPGPYVVRLSSGVATGEAPPDGLPGDSSALAEERIPPEFNAASTLRLTLTAEGPARFDVAVP